MATNPAAIPQAWPSPWEMKPKNAPVVVTCRAIATNPTVNRVSTTVAKTKPPGAARPLP